MGKKAFARIIRFGLILFLSFILVACGGNEDEETVDANEEQAEEVTLDPVLVDEGETIAKVSCIGCHASDLTGDMGPSLHNTSLTKEEIIEVLVKGKGSMPPASADGHEEAVAEYILSLNK